MQNFDGIKEKMVQKTTDVMIQSQHDSLVVRFWQKAYVVAQQAVQFVSDRHRIGSFQASFRNTSENTNYPSEKNVENNRL